MPKPTARMVVYMRALEVRRAAVEKQHMALRPPAGTKPIGSGHFDTWLEVECLYAFLNVLGKGGSIKDAAVHATKTAQFVIRKHNSRRDDPNWQRSTGAADQLIESIAKGAPPPVTDIPKKITSEDLKAAGTTAKKFKVLVGTVKAGGPEALGAKQELKHCFAAIRAFRKRQGMTTACKPQGKLIYVLFVDIEGVWHLSLETDNKARAAIRYADLRTLNPAVVATTNVKLAHRIHGHANAEVASYVVKCSRKDRGVPVREVKEQVAEIPAHDCNGRKLYYYDSRGASYPDATARTNMLQPGDIRPGLAANYFRTKPFEAKDAVTCTVALTKAQRRHMEDAQRLRKKHGYRENEYV